MNNVQCMNPNAMNQCLPPQPPNSMFNPPFSQFDVNNPRCSPNLNFHPNDMNVNQNFYRAPSVSNAGPAPCMPNMHPSVVGTSASDILGVADAIVSNGSVSKSDPTTVDSDIASVVCGIASDPADDLNLLRDDLLRDTKPDEQLQRKSIKEFGDSNLLLGDDVVGVVKDEELETKPNKVELDAKAEEVKRDQVPDKRDSSTPVPSTRASTPSTSNSSSSTTATVTTSGTEVAATESGDAGAASAKSGEAANEDDDLFANSSGAGGASETLSNASAHSNTANENEGSMEEAAADTKIKNEPSEDKPLDSDFADNDDSSHPFHKILGDDKSDANSNTGDGSASVAASGEDSGTAAAGSVQGAEKEAGKAAVPVAGMVKMEGEELFDGGAGMPGPGGMPKNECPTPGGGIRPGGNGFTGPPNMMSGGAPPGSFNVPHTNDMVSVGMMPNAAGCMNDALYSNPMMPNMGRPSLPHNANHATNFPNRNVCKVRNAYKL